MVKDLIALGADVHASMKVRRKLQFKNSNWNSACVQSFDNSKISIELRK